MQWIFPAKLIHECNPSKTDNGQTLTPNIWNPNLWIHHFYLALCWNATCSVQLSDLPGKRVILALHRPILQVKKIFAGHMTNCLSWLRLVEALRSHHACLSALWLVQDESCGVGKPQSRGLDRRKGDLLVKRWPLRCIQRPFDSTYQLILLAACGLCSHAVT